VVEWEVSHHVLRFQHAAATSLTVTYQNLLDAVNLAASATTAYDLYDMVRIKRVTIRFVAGAVGAIGTCELDFPNLVNGTAGSGKSISATAMSASEYSVLSGKPDKMSGNAQWQGGLNSIAFYIAFTGTAGLALVDVEANYRIDSNITPAAVQNAPVGSIVGQVYFRGLDGLRAGLTTWPTVLTPSN